MSAPSRTRFDDLAHLLSEVVVVLAADGRVAWVSGSIEAVLGWRPEAWTGEHPFEFVHPRDLEAASGDLAALLAHDDDVPAGEAPRHRTARLRLRHRNGTWRWIDVAGRNLLADPSVAGVVLTLRDVGGEHAATEALRRLETLAEGTTDMVGIVEPDGRPSYLNLAGRRLLGLPETGSLDHVHPASVYTPESWQLLEQEAIPTAARTGVWRGELTVRPLDGGPDVHISQVMTCERGPDGRVRFFGSVSRDMSERRALEAALRHRANHDELTELPNRSAIVARLADALAGVRPGRLAAVLFFDLDRFKVVNDSLGHQAGDRLLTEVARRLVASVRDGDLAGRFGGDEFVVVACDVGSADEAVALAERVRTGVGGRFALSDDDRPADEVHLSVSVGVATSDGTASPADVLRDADAALYQAKALGRDAVVLFDHALRRRAVARLATEQMLRRAVALDELDVVYQPILDLADGRVHALEALVRWHHPERGLLLPGEFLDVAEETGLIHDIGAWVLDRACADAAAWAADGDPGAPVLFVNLSPRELLAPGLVDRVAGALARHGLPPHRLHLEITEQALTVDIDRASAVVTEVRATGVRFALDDFGTGHSSLAYLRHFPIGVVKIDRSFVGALDEPITAAICEAVIGLAHRVDTGTVAEGIETAEQAATLARLGCRWGQGLHLAPPMPASQVGPWISARHTST